MKIISRRSHLITLAPIAALAAIFVVLQLSAIVRATAVNITGVVKDSAGNTLGGALVYATAPSGSTVLYGPVTTSSTGSYTLPVGEVGTYDIHFDPPSNKGYAPIVNGQISVTSAQTINAQFSSQTHTLSGVVTDNSGNPLSGLTVQLMATGVSGYHGTTTDASGHYSISTPATYYHLHITGVMPGIINFELTQPDSTAINLVNGDMLLNLTIHTSTVSARGLRNNGYPNGAIGAAIARSGTTSLYPGDPGTTINQVNSDTGPASVITNFTTITGATYAGLGLQSSTYVPSICERSGSLWDCLILPLTVTGDVSIDVPQASPATRTFSGMLTDGSGAPMANTRVTLINNGDGITSTLTDTNGNFTIYAMPKKYSLQVSSNGSTHNMTSFTLTQAGSNPTINLITSNVTQNLQISTADLTVSAYFGSTLQYPSYNTFVRAQTNSGTTTLYPGDPGETLSILSEATTPSNDNTTTIGSVVGASYSALGLNVTSPNGSLCAQSGSSWNCITTPLTVAGPANINVPYTP